jgi:hypothetical protein
MFPSPIHAVAQLCRASPERAFEHLASAEGMARWCLGLFETRAAADGLVTGRSLFDGSVGWARLVCHREAGSVTYWLGADPQSLSPRIEARVTPGPVLGHPAGTVMVSMWAWRSPSMSDERWARLAASHECEIELIRAQLEADAASAGPEAP